MLILLSFQIANPCCSSKGNPVLLTAVWSTSHGKDMAQNITIMQQHRERAQGGVRNKEMN